MHCNYNYYTIIILIRLIITIYNYNNDILTTLYAFGASAQDFWVLPKINNNSDNTTNTSDRRSNQSDLYH